MGSSPSYKFYRLSQRLIGQRAGPQSTPGPRPAGPLIWVHSPDPQNSAVTEELLYSLSDEVPEANVLVTAEDGVMLEIDPSFFQHAVPADHTVDVRAFLDYWKPDVAIWLADHLRPILIHEASEAKIPLVMLDSGAAFRTSRRNRLFPGLTRTTLRRFDAIQCGDEATSIALISAGAKRDRVETIGALELASPVLPCNEAEWTTLAAMVATRPVWLAAMIDISELESILAAHGQAMRRSHRLLLIIVPGDLDQAPEFEQVIAEKNIAYSSRSSGGEPETELPVYLADTDGELGLWYRLAPVAFVGQTLTGTGNEVPDPFDAAALGSVVVHGPSTSPQDVAFQRLARAGASRKVSHGGELAHALETLLAPDRAAVMAHAAWQISSAGAEALEHAVATIARAISEEHGAPK